MIKSDEYCNIDGWPAEGDRMMYFKATAEIPLLQDTLIRIILIGLSKTHPVNGRDSIDLAEVLLILS
jgi:integrator complex subunit 1